MIGQGAFTIIKTNDFSIAILEKGGDGKMDNALIFIRGLVRPIISISFVCMCGYLVLDGKIDAKDVLELTGIIVAFHFGEKAALKGVEK